MSNEENHVMSELSSYLNDSAGSDLQITALIESWGGRLRTRKQWQSFLGLKLKKPELPRAFSNVL